MMPPHIPVPSRLQGLADVAKSLAAIQTAITTLSVQVLGQLKTLNTNVAALTAALNTKPPAPPPAS
jgi:hypothetical protein